MEVATTSVKERNSDRETVTTELAVDAQSEVRKKTIDGTYKVL